VTYVKNYTHSFMSSYQIILTLIQSSCHLLPLSITFIPSFITDYELKLFHLKLNQSKPAIVCGEQFYGSTNIWDDIRSRLWHPNAIL